MVAPFDQDGGRIFDGNPENVARLHFLDVEIEFEKTGPDQFYYMIAEDQTVEGDNELDRIALIVGTRQTGVRLCLYSIGRRDKFFCDQIIYERYVFWRKLDPGDEGVRILSERMPREVTHILNNDYSEGKGYFSPLQVYLSANDKGVVTLVPGSLLRDEGREEGERKSARPERLSLPG